MGAVDDRATLSEPSSFPLRHLGMRDGLEV
jgi:hypothetical protein